MNRFIIPQVQHETAPVPGLLDALATGSVNPTETLLQDLLEIFSQPSASPRLLSPGGIGFTPVSTSSSTLSSIVPQPITQINDSSAPVIPQTITSVGMSADSCSSVNAVHQSLAYQNLSSPTVTSTTNNQLPSASPGTPQYSRISRSDLFYSPIIPSPVTSTSNQSQTSIRIPEYSSCPTGGPASLGQQDLLINSPALSSPPLQEALHTECRQNVIPLNLLQATLPPSGQFQTAPQIPLSARSGMLQVALINLEKTHKNKATELQRFYQIQSAKIEADRITQIYNAHQVPSVLPIINQYYDMQHHTLIDNIDLQVHCLRYQFSAAVSPVRTESTSNKENIAQPVESTKVVKRKLGKPKALNDTAVRILTNWYERHIEHPYPTVSAAEVLAKAGGITTEQVKKWFANKRMRNANTKPQREMAAAQRKHMLSCDSASEQQNYKKLRL